jgi:hypothetical protein
VSSLLPTASPPSGSGLGHMSPPEAWVREAGDSGWLSSPTNPPGSWAPLCISQTIKVQLLQSWPFQIDLSLVPQLQPWRRP